MTTCTECGFPIDTPERAHSFIHQLMESIIEHRKVIAELRERLEMGYGYNLNGERVECKDFPDGISCRDETIKLLEARIAELQQSKSNSEQLEAFVRKCSTGLGFPYADWADEAKALLATEGNKPLPLCRGCNGEGRVGNALEDAECPFCKGTGSESSSADSEKGKA